MKKKVLFMMDSLTCGGAEKSLVSLLPLLDYDKVDVTLMLQKRGGVFECYVPKEVNIVSMPQPSGLASLFGRLSYSLKIRLYGMLGKKEHLAETYWKSIGWTLKPMRQDCQYDYAFAYQQGFPTYYVVNHVSAKKKYTWANVDLMKAGYNVDYNAAVYDQYDRVIGVSDAVSSDLVSQGYVRDKSKVVTIYDILNPSLIREMSKKPGFTKEFDGTRLVTTGRMTHQKGYDLAVKAADELRKRGYKFRWSFVGDGVKRPEIEKLIEERHLEDYIELLGEQSNPYPFMAAADIYVQTSIFEGFGLTVTEARILGKAEVCTNFPCAYNQITDGENGLICEMTPEDIANKIEMLLTDKELKAKLEDTVAREVNRTVETESKKVFELLEL